MGDRILAIRLVPHDLFSRFLRGIRKQRNGDHITALAAADTVPEADDTIDWRSFTTRDLIKQLKDHRFSIALIVYGSDQYTSRIFWQAILLARLVCPGNIIIYENGDVSRAYTPLAGCRRAVLHLVQCLYVAAIGLAILSAVVLMAAVADLTELFSHPLCSRSRTESG